MKLVALPPKGISVLDCIIVDPYPCYFHRKKPKSQLMNKVDKEVETIMKGLRPVNFNFGLAS